MLSLSFYSHNFSFLCSKSRYRLKPSLQWKLGPPKWATFIATKPLLLYYCVPYWIAFYVIVVHFLSSSAIDRLQVHSTNQQIPSIRGLWFGFAFSSLSLLTNIFGQMIKIISCPCSVPRFKLQGFIFFNESHNKSIKHRFLILRKKVETFHFLLSPCFPLNNFN